MFTALFSGANDISTELTVLDKPPKKLPINDFSLDSGESTRKKLPLYAGKESVYLRLNVRLDKKKQVDHSGIKAELIGFIEIVGNSAMNTTFMSSGLELESTGTLVDDKSFDFEFKQFQKPYDSYYGKNVKLRYVVRTSTILSKNKVVVSEVDLGVISNCDSEREVPRPLKLDVGMDGLLDISISLLTNCYGIKDVVNGEIVFESVNVLIKRMRLDILKKEILGAGEKTRTTTEEIAEFEVMDGCPIKGKIIRGADSHTHLFG